MSKNCTRMTLCKGLVNRGWRPVRSFDSGILEKNGLLFVYKYARTSASPYVNGDLAGTHSSASNSFLYSNKETPIMGANVFNESFKGYSWHIEKNGWVITKGKDSDFYIVTHAGEHLQETGKISSDVLRYCDEVFDYIDTFSDMEPLTLKQYKHREIVSNDVVKMKRFRPTSVVSHVNGLFVNITEDLADILPLDLVHKYELRGDSYFISLYTADMNNFEYIDKEMDAETFNSLHKKNLIQFVEMHEQDVTLASNYWLKGIEGNTSNLPKYILESSLSMPNINGIIEAYNSHINYTPLLYTGLDASVIPNMIELLECVKDVRPLLNKPFNKDQIDFMRIIALSLYPLDAIAFPEFTSEYMNIKHNEILTGLSNLEAMLLDSGNNVKQAKAIAKVAYKGKGFQHVNRNMGSIMIKFIDYLFNIDLIVFGELVLGRAIEKEDFIIINYRNIPEEAKSILWERIRMILPETFAENKIDRFIAAFQKKLNVIRFSERAGIYLCTNEMSLYLNYNFIRINLNSVPVWSSLLVNERVLVNGEKEDYIMSFL